MQGLCQQLLSIIKGGKGKLLERQNYKKFKELG